MTTIAGLPVDVNFAVALLLLMGLLKQVLPRDNPNVVRAYTFGTGLVLSALAYFLPGNGITGAGLETIAQNGATAAAASIALYHIGKGNALSFLQSAVDTGAKAVGATAPTITLAEIEDVVRTAVKQIPLPYTTFTPNPGPASITFNTNTGKPNPGDLGITLPDITWTQNVDKLVKALGPDTPPKPVVPAPYVLPKIAMPITTKLPTPSSFDAWDPENVFKSTPSPTNVAPGSTEVAAPSEVPTPVTTVPASADSAKGGWTPAQIAVLG